jgi:WD40 repeat protein
LQAATSLDTSGLPAGALAALEADLRSRFPGNEIRVAELLAALAFGMGRGFSRETWAQAATALSSTGAAYSAVDVGWALESAGWHIVAASVETQGVSQGVYRLVHQAFTDHYTQQAERRMASLAEIQRHIVEAVSEGVAGANWLDTDRYLWRHLADHAAECGLLDRFVTDPGFLAVAEPARLNQHIHKVRSNDSRPFAGIYSRAVDRLHSMAPVERMQYIHLIAKIERPELAEYLQPPVPSDWIWTWARGKPSAAHRIIGRHNTSINSVAIGSIAGRAVIVSGGVDGTVRRWDADTGEPIGAPLTGHAGWFSSVAIGAIAGRAVIVSGVVDGTARLWDADTGEPIGAPLTGHAGWFSSVAIGAIAGRAVIVSGGVDGTVRRWDAGTGEPIGAPLTGHEGSVISVAIHAIAGRAVIVSGGVDGTVRRWDADTGEPIGAPLTGHEGSVDSVALGVIAGRAIIVSGGDDRAVRRWDAGTGEPIGAPLTGHEGSVISVAIGAIAGRAVIVSGSHDDTVRLWDAGTGEPIGAPLTGHEGSVIFVAIHAIAGRAVIVSGGTDQTVRLWDAGTGEPIGAPLTGHERSVISVALGAIAGRAVIVSGSHDDTVRLWDADTGEPIGAPLTGHAHWFHSVAIGATAGRAVIVSGGVINPCKSPRMLFHGLENVAGAGKLEEAADQVLLLLEGAHDAQNHPLQHGLVQDRALADLPFGMIPHLLIRVQFGRIRRQVDQLNLAFLLLDETPGLPAVVVLRVIDDHQDRTPRVPVQLLQEGDEPGRIHGLPDHAKAQVPARRNRTDQVHAEAPTAVPHHRGFSHRTPGRAPVCVAADRRLAGNGLAHVPPSATCTRWAPRFPPAGPPRQPRDYAVAIARPPRPLGVHLNNCASHTPVALKGFKIRDQGTRQVA